MPYTRKTKDVYEVQGFYSNNIGWECVTVDETHEDAKRSLKDYMENEPQFEHRIIKKRIKKGE